MKKFVASLTFITLTLAATFAVGQTAPSTSYMQSINRAATETTLNASSSVVGPTNPLTLTAVVTYPQNGQVTGNVTFTVENANVVVATYTAPVSANGTATVSPTLPSGTLSLLAAYSGDSNLLGSSSSPITQSVLGDADFDFTLTPISVPQGQDASVPATVTAINGFKGSISFTCASPISSLGCGVAPNALTVPAPVGAVSPSAPGGQFAVNVTTIATTVTHAGLIGVLLLSLGSIKRRRKYLLMLAAATLALTVGCGTGTRYLQTDGTPKGTYAVTVTGTSGSLSHTKTVLVTVN